MNEANQEDLGAVRHEAQRLLREQVIVERQEALLDEAIRLCPEPLVTLRPRDGLQVRITRRASAAAPPS